MVTYIFTNVSKQMSLLRCDNVSTHIFIPLNNFYMQKWGVEQNYLKMNIGKIKAVRLLKH